MACQSCMSDKRVLQYNLSKDQEEQLSKVINGARMTVILELSLKLLLPSLPCWFQSCEQIPDSYQMF